MSNYIVFLLGMVVGCSLGIFAIGLCQTAREDYFYGPDQDYPATDNKAKTAKYMMEKGI